VLLEINIKPELEFPSCSDTLQTDGVPSSAIPEREEAQPDWKRLHILIYQP
jgi:hypothetical protein